MLSDRRHSWSPNEGNICEIKQYFLSMITQDCNKLKICFTQMESNCKLIFIYLLRMHEEIF